MSVARKRVLHVVRPAEGGIHRHVLSLVDRTDRSRFSLAIAAPADFLQTVPTADLTGAYPVPISAQFSPRHDLAASARLSPLIRDADLIHAHGLRAGWIAALAHLRRPFPLLVTAHNLIEPGGWLARIGLTLIGSRAGRIIAVSEAVAAGLRHSGVPPAKICVVPNGIDPAYFAQQPDVHTARQNFSLSAQDFVVGCIARLSPEKGVDVLMDAARRTPELTYLIAGDGPDRAALSGDMPKNARLLGRIDDTRALLAAADVVAIPSRREGQGIVALEAMASGVPIVASRVGGLAEMLRNEETALLVPPGDGNALSVALTRLQGDQDLRLRLAENAKRLVSERYDLRQMIQAIEAIYDAM